MFSKGKAHGKKEEEKKQEGEELLDVDEKGNPIEINEEKEDKKNQILINIF